MRRLSKWAIIYNFGGQVLLASLALIFLTFLVIILLASESGNLQVLAGSFFGIIACMTSIGYAVLWVHFFRYQLDDEELIIEKGVIAKSQDSIPYDRVQNIGIERSLLARILGISVVYVQTAGSHIDTARSEGTLPGILKSNAKQLREEIIDRSSAQTQTGGL